MSSCRYDGCNCNGFKAHKFRQSAMCIECDHMDEFHGMQEAPELSPHAVRLTTVAPGLYSRSQTAPQLINSNGEPVSPTPTTRPVARSVFVPNDSGANSNRATTRKHSTSGGTEILNLMTEVPESQLQEILNCVLEDARFKDRRDKVAREIFTTEQTYVRSLMFVMEAYRKPIMEDSTLQKEIPRLFSCMFEILSINKILLRNLYNKMLIWDQNSTLGDEFRVLIPFFRVYTAYCASFDDAVKRVQELQKQNSRFANMLEENRAKPEARGLDFRSYLIMPVQRIPRYTLLFQDFLKATPPTHPDYNGIEQAFNAVKDVANRVNEGIREQENRNAILDIQNWFNPPLQLVESHRKFVKSGVLWKVCRKERKKRFFILFSDIFLHCKRQGENVYSLSQQIKLSESLFEEKVSTEPLGFAIRSPKKSFIMVSADEADRDDWVALMKKTISKLPSISRQDRESFNVCLD
eukprot:TRINITY_DN3046_c0_g4_i3.p1 TRINITY_DN3046_c0_g4~~TRINITY_DN3046_c0_g4_i3.p1  ORF type:complete len:465 (+),score=82.54 TRINITY_DN3046_c0_g4_i3:80-1474(+)